MSADVHELHPDQQTTIDPADIRWRVGQISKKDAHKGSLLGYIDARTCMEALDKLDPNWSAVHGDPIIVGNELIGVPCALTVNGVTRSDVGMPSSQEPIKGAYSDALKRAAVHFGIGRELYELPRIYVKLDDYKKPVAIPAYRNGRWTLPPGAGSVFYDREPEDQPERSERRTPARGGSPAATTSSPVPHRTPEEQQLLDELLAVPGMTVARMSLLADAVGVQKGEPATAEQLRAMLARIEPPEDASAHATPAEGGEDLDSPPTDTPPQQGSRSRTVAETATDAAATPAAASGTSYTALTFRTLAAAVLELDASADWTLDALDDSDFGRVFAALGVAEPDRLKAWYRDQPREIRATLRAAGQAPDQRAARLKARPTAEQLKADIEGES